MRLVYFICTTKVIGHIGMAHPCTSSPDPKHTHYPVVNVYIKWREYFNFDLEFCISGENSCMYAN
jgi:hypothetical protein